jgi:3-oxoacyl-[acyl-carrier protein] reductase
LTRLYRPVYYTSSREGADRVVEGIVKEGGDTFAVQGDVAKSADIKRLFAETTKKYGKVDILVNNAGVYEFRAIEQIDAEHLKRIFDLNVFGLILTTQEALNHFSTSGGFR